MCVGGKGFKKVATIAALAGAAYFTGGGSLAGLFGSKAAAGSALGSSLSSSAAPSLLGGLTSGAQAGATLGGSTLGSALSSSAAPSLLGGLTSKATLGSILSSGLGFAKDNSFLLGQGLNLAGVGANSIAQGQAYDDYNKALRINQLQNNDLVAKANKITDGNLQRFSADNQNQLLDSAYEKRIGAAESTYTSPNSIYLPSSDSAPKEVREANARRIGDILDDGRNQISSGAKLGAFGDLNFDNSLNLNEGSRQIGTLQNFQNGNANVLQASAQEAFTKRRTGQTIGEVLQGAGAIANAYSATRPRKSFAV